MGREEPRGTAGQRGAFTLIELLVVIAIIALLVSILVPSLGRAKDMARLVVCASNGSAIGKAAMLYTTANEGFLLRDYDYQNNSTHYLWASRYGMYLGHEISSDLDQQDDRLYDELARVKIYQCPSSRIEGHVLHYVVNAMDFDRYERSGTYGSSGPTPLSAIPGSTSTLFYIADANLQRLPTHQFDLHDCWNTGHIPFSDVTPQPTTRVIHPDDERHFGKATVIYFDGHAAAVDLVPDQFSVKHFNPHLR